MKIKVVSFDMDGTLIDLKFEDYIYYEVIPMLYIKRKGGSFKQVQEQIKKEYEKFVGINDWYRLDFWIRRFALKDENNKYLDPKIILEENKDKVNVYPEVKSTLDKLKERGLRLMLYSSLDRESTKVKLSVLGDGYFEEDFIFSGLDDFNSYIKSSLDYMIICKEVLGIETEELLHVGDEIKNDFLEPKAMHINSYLLNRNGRYKPIDLRHIEKERVLKSLDEVLLRLE